ncbi:hypothetical protein TELCIR_17421 [Teladorsagia circumcincta]|uniref:Ammonium transporter AmtB-like domain-containing protein n=1 Tax=Teladorsagia circumcincta TaxID=45464 RepID=A0A2G9TT08_TELCI|nr:hypothetical protein TELCIR_17421 [Teladorsagia circumcincta]
MNEQFICVGSKLSDAAGIKERKKTVHLVGGISGLVATLYLKPRQHRFKDQRARQISDPTKAILAGCLFYTPWQATLVGAIGSTLALIAYPVLERAKIDDPVGVIPVHVVGSVWGMISPAIFVCRDFGLAEHKVTNENDLSGLLYGGGLTLLSYQLAALGVIAFFSATCAFSILWVRFN